MIKLKRVINVSIHVLYWIVAIGTAATEFLKQMPM